MYNCSVCGETQPAKTPSNTIVIETRNVEYRDKAGDFEGAGVETAREVKVCRPCILTLKGIS